MRCIAACAVNDNFTEFDLFVTVGSFSLSQTLDNSLWLRVYVNFQVNDPFFSVFFSDLFSFGSAVNLT